MTKREEIIEAMRGAIYKEGGKPGKLDAFDLATVAFDSALKVMMEPDSEMVEAGDAVNVRRLPYNRRRHATFTVMLSTLQAKP